MHAFNSHYFWSDSGAAVPPIRAPLQRNNRSIPHKCIYSEAAMNPHGASQFVKCRPNSACQVLTALTFQFCCSIRDFAISPSL
jgi:hypothetical protein